MYFSLSIEVRLTKAGGGFADTTVTYFGGEEKKSAIKIGQVSFSTSTILNKNKAKIL